MVDFVGDLGGVFEIFLGLAGIICCPFSKFDYNLNIARNFYKVRTNDEKLFSKGAKSGVFEEAKHELSKHYNIEISSKNRFLLYFHQYIPISFRLWKDGK